MAETIIHCPLTILPMTADLNILNNLLAGPPGHAHFVGIGGVGMAGLAFHLKHNGWRVSGCDLQCTAIVEWLKSVGIEVRHGHDPAHLAGVNLVVRTSAVSLTHPEIASARSGGIPVFQRGAVLAAMLRAHQSMIVCGTHGKTTTATMLVQILRQAGLDPSHCIGGESAAQSGAESGRVAGAGRGAFIVAEADESDGTLADYEPDIAVVTNIEFDHAEHFADFNALRACFAGMLGRVRRAIVFCADDPQAALLCQGLPGAISYGLSSAAEWRAAALDEMATGVSFQVWHAAVNLGVIRLPVPGRHNVLNALAACAAASSCGADFAAMQSGLQEFKPARRRFELIVNRDDVLVISDYAHHPTEIAATLRALSALRRKRWLVVFQPHRYSRTRALGKDFAAVLAGMAELILAPVYAASEPVVAGGTLWDLYEQVRRLGRVRVLCAESLRQAWDYLRVALRPGDGLLVMGAGDVEQIAAWARTELPERGLAALDPARTWEILLKEMPWKSAAFKPRAELADKTTLRVGGCADILTELGDEEDLTRLLQWTHARQVPVSLLGAGSNTLVSDLGVRGIVVRLVNGPFRQIRLQTGSELVAGAAVPLPELVRSAEETGLAGLEFLSGIPGTVGGALRMNAGAWGEDVASRVAWVRFRNTDGTMQVARAADLGFGYRCCAGLAGKIVCEAAFNLRPASQQSIRERIQDTLQRRAWLRAGPSAGSVFKNPDGDFAGRLLEQAGMKGRRIGGARVLEQHANVIVTGPGATASDVRALIEVMRFAVQRQSGIELVEEIKNLER